MVTKEQLQRMNGHGELHTTIRRSCSKRIGPRNGVVIAVDRVRLNGRLKTWVREPNRFQQPVKYGMWQCFYVTERDAHLFHTPTDCPAGID
jgi:hypothetical protein